MTRSAVVLACIVSLSLAAGVAIADETRPHIRAEVTYETKDQLQALLASDVDITHAHGSEFDVLATPEQRVTMDKVTGLMSLLEGHGDITMDRAAMHLIPSQPRFAKVMSQRRKNATGLTKVVQRLTGMEAKLAQYEEGEKFVLAVEEAGGRELFDQVWTSPETLPTIDEIRSPDLWIERMGPGAGA